MRPACRRFGAVAGSPEALWYNPGALTDLHGVQADFARLSFPAPRFRPPDPAGPLKWKHHLGLLYHRNGTQDVLRDARATRAAVSRSASRCWAWATTTGWRDLSFGRHLQEPEAK